MLNIEFGVYLRQLRSEKMTQEQLAEATGKLLQY